MDGRIHYRFSRKAIEFAVGEGLVVCYVTEDTTRSRPDQLRVLFDNAIDAGASRLVLCDTCGHATPNGVKQLVRFARSFLEAMDSDVGLDWHGHNDRGFGAANALFALEAGVTRVHGTALGVGERVGNTPIDQLLVNLKLLGHWDHDLSGLNRFVHLASEACGVPCPIIIRCLVTMPFGQPLESMRLRLSKPLIGATRSWPIWFTRAYRRLHLDNLR